MATGNTGMLRVRLFRQAMIALCVAGMLWLVLPMLPLPRTRGVGHVSAANCNGWANNPYSIGAWAYGTGGLSCNGTQPFSFQVCLRKRRDYLPDVDTTCTGTINTYTSRSQTAAQCGAHNNYRTRTYYWPTGSSLGATAESSWVYLNANC